jgi:hypothetical protein
MLSLRNSFGMTLCRVSPQSAGNTLDTRPGCDCSKIKGGGPLGSIVFHPIKIQDLIPLNGSGYISYFASATSRASARAEISLSVRFSVTATSKSAGRSG